jgi:putative nucleotidyltransferase with HDIG domain
MLESNSILLICDSEEMSRFLREQLIVKGGYNISFENTAGGGLTALQQANFDLVIAKFNMPDLEGRELLKSIKKSDPDAVIIVLFEGANTETVKEVSKIGIYDFISWPINLEKLFFLIKKGLDLHNFLIASRRLNQSLSEQNVSLQKQNTLLAKRIEESTKNLSRLYEDLRSTYMRTIKVLAQAIDARDHYTHSHSENVSRIAVAIAEEMGLATKDIETLREACELHDLGKIGIVDSILSKPASLTPEEWVEVRKHPAMGAQILEPLTFLNDVTELVRQHHEHFDGSGYPEGRKGDDILLGARIIHLADAYEAMTTPRAYRKNPLSKEQALEEVRKNTGTQFDPRVVEAFLKIVNKL